MNTSNSEIIRLTEYSKGAGCGCKIAPKALQEILAGAEVFPDGNLLVGNSHNDDAAVYDLQNGTALISTTDFFMPIVDDAFFFGKIAAANAISDVYAMGGKPVVAVALLGWPEKIPVSEARKVMSGARETCASAGIAMAGGHSIESAEPFFGLAVNGIVNIADLKKNNTAREGDLLFLTKPIGVGILSTAQKRKIIEDEDVSLLMSEMSKLNSIGERLGKIAGVSAMTDVTGFGLAGHLKEMAEGSGLSVELNYSQVPIYERAKYYLDKKATPDATFRNWQSYGNAIDLGKGIDVMQAFSLLPDPQTNGGLLVAVDPNEADRVIGVLKQNGLEDFCTPVGNFISKQEKIILVK